jgi:hypothetical protein
MQTIKHSGNAGDIIYSLPAMRQVSRIFKQPIHVMLRINVPLQSVKGHPVGSQLSRKMAEMLSPLLLATDFIQLVTIHEADEPCDYDFDAFRRVHNYSGHISQWYFHTYPELTCNLAEPIHFDIEAITPERPILLNRTARYHNPSFDYSIIKRMQSLITFVGLPEEYKVLSAKLPEMDYSPVNDFAELCAKIKGCGTFIGNQSLAFAIAEVMKHPRILEICPTAHNVIPTGENGYGAWSILNLVTILKNTYGTKENN